MEDLKTYVSMVDSRLLCHMQGSAKAFIRAFQAEHYASEEAFMQKICGDKYDINYYYNTKKRTIQILQAFGIISNSYGVSTVQKKYDLCQKKFVIGQKILSKKNRKAGIEQIKDAHKIAIEYDFVHLACELSSILYHNYVYFEPSEKKAIFYAEQVERYLQDYTAEKKAEHYYYATIGKISRSLKSPEFEQSLIRINECVGQSIKYKVYQSRIEVFYGFSVKDYHLIIESCQKSLDVFTSKKGVYNAHYLFCYINMGKAYMALGRYKEAQDNFEKSEEYIIPKAMDYSTIQLHKTLNALHAGNYQAAHELYLQNRRCRFENIREQFAIIEAYLCFLSHMGHLEIKHPFRLGKYLNETFKAQADKEGSNIAILIAELLVYLGRDRGKFIDRIEAVQNYSYRHLKTKDTRRAKRFIKILCMLPKVNFHGVALQRNAQRHIQYLKDHPISMGENVSIEILPFEVLLEMIIKKLNRKVA